jgi:hypothetical protein
MLEQPIADTSFCNEQLGLGRIRLQLLPQVRHVNAEVMRLLDSVRSQHLAHDLAMGQNFSCVLDLPAKEQ